MQIGLSERPIRSQVREFGSPPQLGVSARVWCSGTFVPQSHSGRAPRAPFFWPDLLASFLLHTHLASRVSSSRHKLPPAPPGVRARGTAAPRAERGTRQGAGAAAPAAGSSARVQAASQAPTPRGRAPPVLRQPCQPCAGRPAPDCGSVLWGSGNSRGVQNTENRLIT